MSTGERIKEARLRKGWTQEELGERIGVQKAAIAKYECGVVTNLKRQKIADLASALDVSPAWLMCMDDEPNEDTDRLEALHQDPRLCLLFDRARKMSSEDVDFMLKFADKILGERESE